jgi:hypothetical protein
MKNKKNLWFVLILASFCITGCATSRKPVPARYSFAGGDVQTASIYFVQGNKIGVRLVDLDGNALPSPSTGTYWEPNIIFPAEKPLDLRVFIYWKEDQYGERRRGIFKCPPLQTGKEYKLWFKGDLKGGSIILTYSDVSDLTYIAGNPQFQILHEQVIPPPPNK